MMAGWDWLEQPDKPHTWGFFARVVVKALVLFGLFNAAFYAFEPMPLLGKISIYNRLVPGRERFAYAENPTESYNVTTANLNALFSSHAVSAPKAEQEYRVLVLGDSAVWGEVLMPQETITGALNARLYRLNNREHMRFYNLGYLHSSVSRDVLLLDRALDYQPDMVVWFVTLYSFMEGRQTHYLLSHNKSAATDLYQRYPIPVAALWAELPQRHFFELRDEVNTLLQLQVYGAAWAITGIDQFIPEVYPRPPHNLFAFNKFDDFSTPKELNQATRAAFDLLTETIARHDETMPFVVVNEPMFLAQGANSDTTYNNYYPHWAYDTYRDLLHDRAMTHDWNLVDLWDAIPANEFSNTELHLTAQGARILAGELGPALVGIANERE